MTEKQVGTLLSRSGLWNLVHLGVGKPTLPQINMEVEKGPL